MRYETCIKRYGKETNLWYIDVKGVDQNGRTVWLSGNVLDQGENGYGGFHDWQTAKNYLDYFENFFILNPASLVNCSEDGVTSFTPKRVYLGYSPLDLNKDNILWESRLLK